MNLVFQFEPAAWIPFRDRAVLERCRAMTREELVSHPNPDFRISIVLSVEAVFVSDMIARIVKSDLLNESCVMIIPNPWPSAYQAVAEVINAMNINCRNVHIFGMDEWADDQGNIAPIGYKAGFGHSLMKYLISGIRRDLRPPAEQIHFPSNENKDRYTDLICEAGGGGASVCYVGPGWAGHIGFVDPMSPEFATDDIEAFTNMGARLTTLHPLTIAQNSLHGTFGMSGDIANVPPRAFTIGPKDVRLCRERVDMHSITTGGTMSSWQRMTTRLCLHGPVTPLVPASILQQWPTRVYVSELSAAPICCSEVSGY